nr:phosphatase PAP2 family protein [Govania unica]
MGATYGLKKTVHRERPDMSDNESFPSGHAARAFAGASYLQFRYGSAYGLPMYLASGAVGWSRVDARKHHWTDVIASGVLTTAVAWFTTSKYQDIPVNVSLMMGEDQNRTYGLAANMQF